MEGLAMNGRYQRLRIHYPERLGGGLELNVGGLDFAEAWVLDVAALVRRLMDLLRRFIEKLLGWRVSPEVVYH